MNDKNLNDVVYEVKNVSRETFLKNTPMTKIEAEMVEAFFHIHERYKRLTSLVRYRDEEEFFNRHVLDAWQIGELFHVKHSILDMGSGGGFPGIIMAIRGHEVTLSDVDHKKRFFLEECIRILDLKNARVITNCKLYNGSARVVTARALAALDTLLGLIPHCPGENVSRETFLAYFHKGKNYVKEVEDAEKNWTFTYNVHPSKTDENGCILEIGEVRPRG